MYLNLFLLFSVEPNNKKSFFDNFLKNDFLKKKKVEDYKTFLKNEKIKKSYFDKQKKKQVAFQELVQYFKDDFYIKEKDIFAVSNRSRYFPGFDIWNFLTNEEELLWHRMNKLWTAVVNYFTDEKYDYLFNKVDQSTKEEDLMLLHSADDLDIFLTFIEDGEDEDFYTGLFINDDDNPDFVEIYDDDMYMITFVWSFFLYCFLLCFDFSGFFFFPFLPIIMLHYYMYEPDVFDEEDNDPEQILLDNMYKNDAEFVEYQYQFFSKNFLTYKSLDYLYFVNLVKFEKNSFLFSKLKKNKILKNKK